nr:la-related protein 6-like [Procambarus clarkii]
MLNLLSRIVIRGEHEDRPASRDKTLILSGSDNSSVIDDTDEELLSPPALVINITQMESADNDLSDQISTARTSVEQSALIDEKLTGKNSPVVLPSRDVCRRILELVEYYLSDHNLVKDMFLLKHVTKHHEGYVSLKLLASYKKVKRLTKDWRVVAHSLKHSKTLEMNEDETKVRRQQMLPHELEEDTRPFRTLLATNISKEEANMNYLAEFFAKFGEMTSLQLHKPSGRALEEVRQANREHPGIISTFCAIVEYEKVHYARHAIKYILNNPECNMNVVELPRKKRQNSSNPNTKPNAEGESAYYSTSDMSEPTSPASHLKALYKSKSPYSSMTSSPIISPISIRRHYKSQLSSPESSPPSSCSPRRGPSTPCSSPERSSHFVTRCEVPGSSPLPRRQLAPRSITSTPCSPNAWRRMNLANKNSTKVIESGPPLPLSPWLRRRVVAYPGNVGSRSAVSSPSASPGLQRRHDTSILVHDSITRLPRGPDGTRGFLPRQIIVNAQT